MEEYKVFSPENVTLNCLIKIPFPLSLSPLNHILRHFAYYRSHIPGASNHDRGSHYYSKWDISSLPSFQEVL